MSLIILKIKIVFRMFPMIQIALKHVKSNLTKIRKSIGQALLHCVLKVGQLVNLYCTNIRTSTKQTLVSKNKHIQTNQNSKNINKQEKEKKEFYFFEFLFQKFIEKMKISNRYKFYELNVCQTKNGVGQNRDYFVGFV